MIGDRPGPTDSGNERNQPAHGLLASPEDGPVHQRHARHHLYDDARDDSDGSDGKQDADTDHHDKRC
jgi:hypothetical protein